MITTTPSYDGTLKRVYYEMVGSCYVLINFKIKKNYTQTSLIVLTDIKLQAASVGCSDEYWITIKLFACLYASVD